ncbi:MAG: DUF1998 domain-containing protein [Acidobacteriota bacterium]
MIAERSVPARPARYAPFPAEIHPDLVRALEGRGVVRLFEHQALALETLGRGEHPLVVTPTASGKSLIYQIPALQAALRRDGAHRSLFLFPYKALARDQLGALEGLARDLRPLDPVRAAIYDGDTPAARRRRIRADLPEILLTNPDMLHLGLLAHHEAWRDLFGELAHVVLDELHVYRGILGAHLHHVLRRLRRICRHYGSEPRFIVSSATVANPGRFAEMLAGVPFTVVDRSGAPRAARHFVLLNPPASPYTAAAHLLAACMDAGLKTIAFTKARRITELMQRWITMERPDLRRKLAAYRAGYLPEERRDIEQRLFSGDLLGVISTSALELGVDVGGLDVCILVGYPGSIVRFWQRTGRVGRRERDSLVVLIGLPDALDQFFLRHPEELFERGYEEAVADPDNEVIARAHLICAGAELPMAATEEEPEFRRGTLRRALDMAERGELVLDAEGCRLFSLRRRPQRDVDLRAGGPSFAILEAGKRRTIGQVDGGRVFRECHPGAIYLHAGAQYRVEHLDLDRRRIFVSPSDDDYYTEVLSEKETEILEVYRDDVRGIFRAGLGRLRVTEDLKGFHRRRLFRQEVLSTHPLDLPPQVFETVGLWLDLPEAVRDEVARREGHFMGAIHAVEHAAISLFPLLAIADRGDIGGISYPLHPQTSRAGIFIYDGHPGGVGLAARGFDELQRLLERTREQLASCNCESGCPSCIHSPKCGNGNKPLDKPSALWLLELLTGSRALEGAAPPPPVRLRPRGPDRAAATPADVPPAPALDAAGRRLAFDLETRRGAADVGGWGHVDRMGLALAVVQDLDTGAVRSYREEQVKDLILDLLTADLVVGYNVLRFDYRVLEAYASRGALRRVPTLDLLQQIHGVLGFRVKLDDLARATLGRAKSADGLQSLEWFRQGRMDLIEEYCRQDVAVTADLYRFGRTHGYLLYADREGRRVRIPARWQGSGAAAPLAQPPGSSSAIASHRE